MNVYMFSLTQFIVDYFGIYLRSTDISLLFNVQVKHMYFYKFFLKYNVFIYALTVSQMESLILIGMDICEHHLLYSETSRKD